MMMMMMAARRLNNIHYPVVVKWWDFFTGICEDSDDDGCDGGGDNDGCDLEGLAPTPKRRKLAREEALKKSCASGWYPKFDGCEGPAQLLDPSCNNEL